MHSDGEQQPVDTAAQLKAKLTEILMDFYDDMQDTEESIRVDTYDGTDDTYSDQHGDWIDTTKEKDVSKIMKELHTLEQKHRAEVEKAEAAHLKDLKILWTETLGKELDMSKPPKFNTLPELREIIQKMQVALTTTTSERKHEQ